jgi:hypothetical protein
MIIPLQQWLLKNASILKVGQATDDKMAHAHCMVDIKGYKHTMRICNT